MLQFIILRKIQILLILVYWVFLLDWHSLQNMRQYILLFALYYCCLLKKILEKFFLEEKYIHYILF